MSISVKRLERMRVAAPCPVSWQSMKGDDRVRFCAECKLHVYDISQLTRREATALINETEGGLCARVYRRTDGTVLTKDCPVGLRAVRRRLAATAGTAFATLLSLCANVFGQNLTHTSRQTFAGGQLVTLSRTFRGTSPQEEHASLRGVITDPYGAVVPGAKVSVINEQTKRSRKAESNDEGQFEFRLLEPGLYTIRIESGGFKKYEREHLKLFSNEEIRFDMKLDLDGTVTVGLFTSEDPLEKGITIDGVRVRINE